jgi:uncharacterized membrane protein
LLGEIYAILTALLRGFSTVTTRRGLKYSNPNTSALIYLIINTLFLWSLTLFLYPVDKIFVKGFEYFILAGLVAPGIAVIFRDISFKKLGVALTSPIVGTTTFFSMIIAIIFFDERVTIYLVIGSILIFLGLNILTNPGTGVIILNRRDMIYPVIAALLFATSISLRKLGLMIIESPLIGATITSTSSLLSLITSFAITHFLKKGFWVIQLNKDGLKFFVSSGFILSIAFIFYFMALSSSYIVKIQPLAGTDPLFAIFFSYFFLKDMEKITSKTIIGPLLIVFGIILITL